MVALSVIVPIYDVERYLEECLRSLRVQTLTDLEVVMVDDGSPDGSVDIAAEFVERDPRFRLIRQENAGLGAARNTGIEHARGEFITFVDSDDVIPPRAFDYHLESLLRTGSDFSTGNVHRFNELGAFQSPMHRAIFRTSKPATHILREDSLHSDRLATNKVWRRSFWDAQGFSFPVGVLYEDVPIVIPLHFLAKSVDVLSQPVYLWRERPSDDKSITQDRMRPKAMEDRFSAVSTVESFLAEHGSPEQKRRWDTTALKSDLRIFLQLVDQADDAFTERFLRLANAYLDKVDAGALRALPSIERLKWHMVRLRDVERLREVLAFNKSPQQRRARVVRHGIRFYGDYPFKDDRAHGVPREVYRLRSELRLRQKVEEIVWDGDRMVVRGRACLKFLRPNRRVQQWVRAWAVHAGTGRRVRLSTSVHRANEFRSPLRANTARKDWGGYEIVVDPMVLKDPGEWYFEIGVVNRGLRRRERLGEPAAAAVRQVAAKEVRPGVWARPSWVDGRELSLAIERPEVVLGGSGVEDGALVLSGRVLGRAPTGATGSLRPLPGGTAVPASVEVDGTALRLSVDLDQLTSGFEERAGVPGSRGVEAWEVHVDGASGTSSRVALEEANTEAFHMHDGATVRVSADSPGRALVHVEQPRPYLTEVAWEEQTLCLRGIYQGRPDEDLFLVLSASGRVEEHLFPFEAGGGRFDLRLTPAAVPRFGTSVPLVPGNYWLKLRRGRGQDRREDRGVGFARELRSETFVAPEQEDGFELELRANATGASILRVGSMLRPDERGGYAQKVLREEVYPVLRQEPVTRSVLFDSYSGKQFSDSPRDMYEELVRRGVDVPMSWNTRDRQLSLPDGLTEVRTTGRDYFEALARSEFIVSNAHLPAWFEKRPGQTFVQTWHGSMLKRIGFDIEQLQFAIGDYHERLRRETAQWDYLVSPSPWATPILRRAFGFEGEILETGYPRNDIFHKPEREALTEQVRARLGLPEGKKVVLYAPTWRDDQFYARGKYKLDLRLDLERLHQALGDDHVLLVRRHPNIVDRVPTVGEGFVHDVSAYPEIQELFLVTDILVTDYSSLMFDFANTGRPMLFFTYDLEAYRDNLRGFYFDFEATAPGPLLRTSDEVIEAVRAIDEVGAAYKGRYRSFVDQYCPLDDGKAAARVVERVFGRLL